MTIEYQCGDCGEHYTRREYDSLDRVPIDPDEPDPMKGKGYEKVCGECGSRFHTDKWTLRDTIQTEDAGEVTVSTVALLLGHGPNHNQWFETCIFHDGGSQVTDRYSTKDDAKDGHEDAVERVREGEYGMVPTGSRIDFSEVTR